jgi:hypothetical protein
MIINDAKGFGKVEVSTVPLPEGIKNVSATYIYSGKVLLSYKDSESSVVIEYDKIINPKKTNKINNYYKIAVMNDDGSGFKAIFSGEIPQKETANGIRFMPFWDNKRVLLGDYVLECTPDIDNCEKAEIIPVTYPMDMAENPNILMHWSEIIISPDNEHIAWTTLESFTVAYNFIGRITRKKDRYIIEDTKIISTLEFFKKDEENEGFLLPQVMRGGEVKQFASGGKAISLAGTGKNALPDSVLENLETGEIKQLTDITGYEETTMLSPDEKLGIVMSTRASEKTNFSVLGLLPRPYSILAMEGMIMNVYLYAVAGVRSFRQGNVGPVLIDVETSAKTRNYMGVPLNDPEGKWVYCSPISWHPGNKKAMWPEILRKNEGNEDGSIIRIRKVTLHDYVPKESITAQNTPDNIPYAIECSDALPLSGLSQDQGKIAGKHTGYIRFAYSEAGSTESEYVNFSDDGKTFYNGFEKSVVSLAVGSTYESELTATGENEGEMKIKLTFSPMTELGSPKLIFENDENGNPKSYGYSKYNGVTLYVNDLSE